ncbi:MAG: hypothetical protein OER95_10585 [Acidimicrobiia bacterium]|nr:hypothetical protein [Acidimicrobiia bacterium]
MAVGLVFVLLVGVVAIVGLLAAGLLMNRSGRGRHDPGGDG